ncbi:MULTISPECIES: hypothetical protein [Actinomycetes]|uniref:Uncharacterized protein n=1 Tax=Streptomyces acidiscabies TaxID=42234 RepID=A0ABU4ME26_9ACTN|nr:MULTISPECIES: hypothetical protein [Actinomycetes]MDX2973472.1 hypothetical protein [Kribbella solani]MDX3007055.1 hypothetical protein [Kribbella solani]MDX3026086.1 hypothetical protein [Streptomyces acidiscabies]
MADVRATAEPYGRRWRPSAVRHHGDVRRESLTYAATAAGLVLLVVVAAQHLHVHLWHF